MTATGTTLFDCLKSRALVHPDRFALIINDEPISYVELLACVEASAESLSRAGVTPGDRVGVLTSSKRDVIIGLLSAFAVGAIAVPLLGDSAKTDEFLIGPEFTAILGSQVGLDALVSDTTPVLVPIEDSKGAPIVSYIKAVSRPGSETAVIIRSSGTTSAERKSIEVSYRGLAVMVGYLNRIVAIPEGGAEYLNSPVHHAFGLGRLHAVLAKGGTLISDDGIFNPLRALAAVRRHSCSSMAGVASTFDLLVEKFSTQFSDYGRSLRWLEISSMPMTPARKRQLLIVLPRARPVMSYGLTEAMRSIFLDFREFPHKLDSVGQTAPGVETTILDSDGAALPIGGEGEIALRGINRANGYWRRPDLWAARMAGNWFRTGDRGRIDTDGFVYFLGRNDDVINSGGRKISPEEIESVLAASLQGAQCAVVGKPDPILGEVPVLFVEGKLDDEIRLRQAISATLPVWQQPRELRCVDALPRTSNGKLLRRELKKVL
jgi:acyl-CoA synthetase (AMP-forming)/AMP-acid ligase II